MIQIGCENKILFQTGGQELFSSPSCPQALDGLPIATWCDNSMQFWRQDGRDWIWLL